MKDSYKLTSSIKLLLLFCRLLSLTVTVPNRKRISIRTRSTPTGKCKTDRFGFLTNNSQFSIRCSSLSKCRCSSGRESGGVSLNRGMRSRVQKGEVTETSNLHLNFFLAHPPRRGERSENYFPRSPLR
ncbi:hypothetical protein TNCV_3964691 [Trichonephila clavipes]|nr:hypothetical protein TNCV_3964691 [Trichonephila clavipes]